jgi:hypothetical protein
MMLDLVNVDRNQSAVTGCLRADPKIHVALLDGGDRILTAFRMDDGVVTDRWVDGKGPCGPLWHPLTEAS